MALKTSEQFLRGTYLTDKYDLGYLENFYDQEFSQESVKLLEIGADRGGSIALWRDYFPDSKIFAVDVNDFPDHGAHKIIADAYGDNSFISDNYFDIVIDDGPHTYESFVAVIQNYHRKLKTGGRLIVEDIIVRDWVEPLRELAEKQYAKVEIADMTGKQRTPTLLNKWRDGLFILKAIK
jgi:SAM-dependent methyltransferase